MREIKFRAWHEEEKEMISGNDLAFEEYDLLKNWLSQDEIMQFTGLRDANLGHDKREIYEKDIIEWDSDPILRDKRRGTVRFQNGSFIVSIGDSLTIYLARVIQWGGVVVGNEFENVGMEMFQ